eukprot:2067559-Rhodomonas_salina.1
MRTKIRTIRALFPSLSCARPASENDASAKMVERVCLANVGRFQVHNWRELQPCARDLPRGREHPAVENGTAKSSPENCRLRTCLLYTSPSPRDRG